MPWEDSIFLRQGEEMIHHWRGNCEATHTIFKKKGRIFKKDVPKDVKDKKKGILALTSHRLIWLEGRGRLSKSYHTIFETPLEEITGISMGGMVRKYVSIGDPTGEKVFYLSGVSGSNFDKFRQRIFEWIDARKQSLQAERQKERVHVHLDFSFLKNYMKEGGLMLQVVKCPECGASVDLPETGNQIYCAHCGKAIYAQDLFTKVKELIG